MESGHQAFYDSTMLKAGVFDDFKGATTLLLWGDGAGMAALSEGFSGLLDGSHEKWIIHGAERPLTVHLASPGWKRSRLMMDQTGLCWECSHDIIDLAAWLLAPLLAEGAGHQFLEVDGLAEQVIIARDEYPADLR